ncbi:MAG TPA: diacylglycerol kinase family protein [Candidatus Acidoferrales bacterium]|nr:diacylglycerol kinase family protein [Candidatus Acidoferrales bacterium]
MTDTSFRHTVKFIVNPVSGNGRTGKILPHLLGIAKRLGVNFDLQLTKAPEHATELASDRSDQFDVMVAVGGDGTVNEVAAGAFKSQKIMGVIPTGTGNDFARALGKLKSLHDYVHRLVSGKIKSIDIGSVQMDGREALFVNGVGVGFDAEVAKESLSIHGLKGISKYLLAVAKTLRNYKSSFMKIELDDRLIEQRTFLVAIGNGISAGGGFLLTPHALLDDGILDVCMACELSIPKVMRILPRAINGTLEKRREVLMTRTTHIRIQSETPVSIHRDGEVSNLKVGEIAVQIIPGSLKVIA